MNNSFSNNFTNTTDENKTNQLRTRTKRFHFILINTRSLAPKLDSLIEKFQELELSFAVILETWLAEGPVY